MQEVSDPQTHNAYSYVRNNPVNFVDPDGLGFFKKLLGFLKLIIGVVLVVIGAVQMYFGDEGFGAFNLTMGLSWTIGGARDLAGAYGNGTPEVTGPFAYPSLQTAMLGAGVLKAQTMRASSFQASAEEPSQGAQERTPVDASVPEEERRLSEMIEGFNLGDNLVDAAKGEDGQVERDVQSSLIRRAGQIEGQKEDIERLSASDSIIDRFLKAPLARRGLGFLERRQRIEKFALQQVRRRIGRDPITGRPLPAQ